jgi:dienelactone hydrolase
MNDVMRDEILSLTYRPTYRKAQADDVWKRLQEWLKRYL